MNTTTTKHYAEPSIADPAVTLRKARIYSNGTVGAVACLKTRGASGHPAWIAERVAFTRCRGELLVGERIILAGTTWWRLSDYEALRALDPNL